MLLRLAGRFRRPSVMVCNFLICCTPLVADLFLFCYERVFLMSLSDDKQVDIIDALSG